MCITWVKFVCRCSADVSAALLLLFCSEGDNALDAIQLATAVNTWLHLVDLKVGGGRHCGNIDRQGEGL